MLQKDVYVEPVVPFMAQKIEEVRPDLFVLFGFIRIIFDYFQRADDNLSFDCFLPSNNTRFVRGKHKRDSISMPAFILVTGLCQMHALVKMHAFRRGLVFLRVLSGRSMRHSCKTHKGWVLERTKTPLPG